MHSVKSAKPSAALRRYVRAYLQRGPQKIPAIVKEPAHARLEPVLHFNLGDPFEVRYSHGEISRDFRVTVAGHFTSRRLDLLMTGRIDAFAVFFEPTGFSRIFGIPSREMVNEGFEGGGLLGDSIYTLRDRLGEAGSFEERVGMMEEFLLRRLTRARAGGVFTMAADQIFAAQGIVRVADIASGAGLSQRQFERGFLAETGCPPKLYARVARFQTALDMKVASPGTSWLEIAHSLCYTDQMHMVHDFRSLSGNSPVRFMAELGTARPRAVAKV